MQTHYKEYKNTKWINIINSEKENLNEVFKSHNLSENLNQLIIENKENSFKNKVIRAGGFLFLSLQFPILKHEQIINVDIDFLISKNVLITISHNKLHELDNCFNSFEQIFNNNNSNNNNEYINAIDFFEYILIQFYKSINLSIHNQSHELKKIIKNVFKIIENSESMNKIANLNINTFEYKSIIKSHKNILQSFSELLLEIMPSTQDREFKFQNEFTKILFNLENQSNLINEFKSVSNILIAHKTEKATKIIAILSAIFLPLIFIASVLSMSIKYPPDFAINPFSIFYILCIMLIIAIGITIILKIKKII